jgi:hypothetical protein
MILIKSTVFGAAAEALPQDGYSGPRKSDNGLS